MYQIYFTKAALKQLPNLKAAKLDGKAKALIEILKENPYQNPPPDEKLAISKLPIPDESTSNTAWSIRYWRKNRRSKF